MVLLSPAPPALSSSALTLYYTIDPLLARLPILIFYGPSTTTNATLNSSRIQAHIYSLAGFQSFPRLTISPTSPLYAAVSHLSDEHQGDEICRGLAMSLLKYFAEIPKAVKTLLVQLATQGGSNGLAPAMFDEIHAADLAGRMVASEDNEQVANHISSALSEKNVSWVDMTMMLPSNSIQRVQSPHEPEIAFLLGDDGSPPVTYGKYENLVKLFGSPSFLPTSKLRRAPSKPKTLSRTKSLARDQKASLRREMWELHDTEERYVGKLYDLVHSVSVEFQQDSHKPYANVSPSQRAMGRLFPQSLTQILETNTAFIKEIGTLLKQSEEEANHEIRATSETGDSQKTFAKSSNRHDAVSVVMFAKALLQWFPRFAVPYQDYMRASAEFPRVLNDILRDSEGSQLAKQIYEIGEQQLRSMFIEPVQRLPRYSLFIDNMVTQLPSTHPAVSHLLKAKDIITDICALDNDEASDSLRTNSRLRSLISSWPTSLSPHGRLIAAVDTIELSPPYLTTSSSVYGQAGMLLLFPRVLILLRKTEDNSLSARGILAEVDRPNTSFSSATVANNDSNSPQGLEFQCFFNLHDVRFSESHSGCLVWMTCLGSSTDGKPQELSGANKAEDSTRVFFLSGSYEGKAARWNEEVVRAGIEGRFSESLRESDKWALRSIDTASGALGILTAVCEADIIGGGRANRTVGHIGVIVDGLAEQESISVGSHGVEILILITVLEYDRYRLQFHGSNEYTSTEIVTIHDLFLVFTKKLENTLRVNTKPQAVTTSQAYVSFHQKILESLPVSVRRHGSQSRHFRPVSPVKVISNLLGGGSSKESSSPTKNRPGLPYMNDAPVMLPPSNIPARSSSYKAIDQNQYPGKVTVVSTNGTSLKDELESLEDTFAAFVVALRSRSGNVVGKILRGRASADELLVNELYNVLVEDPSRIQAAAEVPVDVLFASFEKFINNAWNARMGPVLTTQLLGTIQISFDSLQLKKAEDHFKILLGDISPQNRRAFKAMIKLLSDLLEASGNDGDRGALIASFAEALVVEGNPHDYISLLDRLVEDYDNLFDNTVVPNPSERSEPGSTSGSLSRARSVNTGSLSSNASSLRKRFGFNTLSRENSKTDSQSRFGSVLRTLSKGPKNSDDTHSQPSSISKGSLSRSKSTDMDARMLPPIRPASRERPALQGVFSQDISLRPGSAHNNIPTLTTIGEASPAISTPSPRKKRRSSLSDLKTPGTPVSPLWSSPQQRKISNSQIPSPQFNRASPITPSPRKQLVPQPDTPSLKHGSRAKKEHSPLATRNTLTERAVNRKSDDVVITSLSPQKRQENTSIPALKRALNSRPATVNSHYNLSPDKQPRPPPQKLRIQSPQKIRDRLQQEQRAFKAVETDLQAELAQIGHELSAINLNRQGSKHPSSAPTTAKPTDPSTAFASRVTSLESKLSTLASDFTTRSASILKDVESSLVVNERKAKSLDELYREANAENEALYERFNEELGKVLAGVKEGKGGEEMKAKMKEAQDEVGRLKKENMRLRREVLGLRAQLRE